MDTRKRGSTSEMQVTSIRLELELKERLREISGTQGYQVLIRDILWHFIEQQPMPNDVELYSPEDRRLPSHLRKLSTTDIRATFEAIARQEERCAVTGQSIQPQQMMMLGLTISGDLLPLSLSTAM